MNKIKNLSVVLVFILLRYTLCNGQENILSETISLSIRKGSLQNALQEISNQTGLKFAYRTSLIQNKEVKTKSFQSPLSLVLDEILGSNGLCYNFQNKQIIIHTNCLPKRYIISGTVLEDSLFEPLPYVFVSISGKSAGAIADENGYYELESEWTESTEELVFSSMGFYRDSLTIKAGKAENLTAVLKRKTYSLPELIVRAEDYNTEKQGNTKDRATGSLYLDTHGQQAALYIKNKRKGNGYLTSLEFFLSDEGNTDAPVRIRVYLADSNGFPGTDLIEDALIVKPKISSGWYSVNIEQLHIAIPEHDYFIAIEGVFPDDYDQYYGESEFIDLGKPDKPTENATLSYGQRLGYNRKCRKETWHYSMSKVWFQLNKQSFGVMIVANVKYRQEKKNENAENNE